MKRLHIHVSVPDLQQSIHFYRALFNQAPSVTKDDYAKWMLDDPAVNFAISTGRSKSGVNHLGLQFDSDEEIIAVQERLDSAHILGRQETNANCCYANSNKYWTIDPSGIPWEQFHTLSEIPIFGATPEESSVGCGCDTAPRTRSGNGSCCR